MMANIFSRPWPSPTILVLLRPCSGTRIDNSFPNVQLKIESHKSFKKDRDTFGGGLHFYVNEQLNYRSLESYLPDTFIAILPLELRLLNSKCLILGTYKPASHNEPTHVSEIQSFLTYILLLFI